ncbi:hypothetical protein TNCV_1868531 [Trichonephila clavipes]|nr:hypothetical protein TNCV_1868531 [Trichonephila clavipes]
MDMVDAWSPAESRFSRSRICSICVSLSPNRGASPFCSMTLYIQILERTICLVQLITSDWSRTSAELPHRVHCLLEVRENLMTHPQFMSPMIPRAWECLALPCGGIQPLSDGKIKRIPPN